MSRSRSNKPAFTGQAAQFQNLREDGIRIRAAAFRNKKAYNRNDAKRQSRKEDY